MIKDTRIRFSVDERNNAHAKRGKKWALKIKIGNCDPWTIHCWDKKPSQQDVGDSKQIALRAMEFYHRHMEIPRFKLEVLDD